MKMISSTVQVHTSLLVVLNTQGLTTLGKCMEKDYTSKEHFFIILGQHLTLIFHGITFHKS